MIRIESGQLNHIVMPTRFPDKTSQVWHLPDWVKTAAPLRVVWNFDDERELIDLMSLFKLLPDPRSTALHIPYLPFARQDKNIGNDYTFNLHVLADLLRLLDCGPITSVDTHNPLEAVRLIPRFRNINVKDLHVAVVTKLNPDYVVFPDLGALQRYHREPFSHLPLIIFNKERNHYTGEVVHASVSFRRALDMAVQGADLAKYVDPRAKLLIVDDICDGGATFISAAKFIRAKVPDAVIELFVTHGIFSKGKEHLLQNGIDAIYTTNSLSKNVGEFEV